MPDLPPAPLKRSGFFHAFLKSYLHFPKSYLRPLHSNFLLQTFAEKAGFGKMNVSITNSKFSSLSFRRDWQAPFDTESCYVQKFAVAEEIRIQFASSDTGFEAKHISETEVETPLTVTGLITVGEKTLFEVVFSVNTPGFYRFELTGGPTDPAEAYFCVQPVEELEGTILLSCTHRKNDFETIFDNRRFNFRVEGGIYPGDKTQAIENETFRDQRFTLHQTVATAYEVSTLTIGSPKGVPQWVANKINWIFCLSDVEIDGVKSVRNESATPELVSTGANNPLYVHKIRIEQPDRDFHTLVDPYGFLAGNDNTYIQDNNSNYIKARIK
jgi:hypothetical protein